MHRTHSWRPLSPAATHVPPAAVGQLLWAHLHPVSIQNQSPAWGNSAVCWIFGLQFRDSCCLPCFLSLCKPFILAPGEGAAVWVSETAVAAPSWGGFLQQVGDKFLLGGNETSTVPSTQVHMGELVCEGELHGFVGADIKFLEKLLIKQTLSS